MGASSTASYGSEAARSGRTLVLGLGNEILADDRVGLLVARRIAAHAGSGVDVAEAAMATIDLISLVAGYHRVVVIDAVLDPERPPGSTIRATPDDLPEGFGFRSFHTMPFKDALRLGEVAGIPMPPEVVIHGMVVSEVTDFGEALSPEVERAWRPWADRIVTTELGAASGFAGQVGACRQHLGGEVLGEHPHHYSAVDEHVGPRT